MKARYDEGKTSAPRAQRVLVVDDEPDIVKMMQAYLLSAGIASVGVYNGEHALARVAERDIDMVLLDVRMPNMDGFEVCRRLRADPANAQIPVVFLTAENRDLESELAGLEAGADEYLHKPIHRKALVARVKNLLRLADAERGRRMAAQVAQSEKLAAIGQIAAGVAHEFNNPLAFILSNVSSLRDYLEDFREVIEAYRRSPEAGRAAEQKLQFEQSFSDMGALLGEIDDGGNRVRRIVQELKAFSREDDSVLERVDLAEVTASTLLLTERAVTEKARVERVLESAVLPSAPRNKLSHVVLNLMTNAVQAVEGASERVIRVRTRVERDEAVLSVSDTGCGIAPDHLERIFDPFFTTQPIGQGTGMGLSVCANVVRKLGGRIQVESALGHGSEFIVRIPRGAVTTTPLGVTKEPSSETRPRAG